MFFDNLQVVHTRGPLVEETHYYPWGLTMAGISSKALNGLVVNKKKFNEGTELNTDFDISLYETPFRSYDPQIGRFHQIDKLGEIAFNWSGYVFASNNPILRNDPLGLKDTIVNGEKGETKTLENVTVTASKKTSSVNSFVSSFADIFLKFGGGAGTLPMPRSGTGIGSGAGAAGAFGVGLVIDYIDRHWEEMFVQNLDETLTTAWLSIISDPAVRAQLEKIILLSDAIVAELNKMPGTRHQVYDIVAQQPMTVPDLQWGGLAGPLFKVQMVPLQTNDIVKIGITSKPMVIGPSTLVARYTKGMLPPRTTESNVVTVNNKMAARFMESTRIIQYAISKGSLPPLNKMLR